MSTPFTDGLRAYADALDGQSIPFQHEGFPSSYAHLLPSPAAVRAAAERFDVKYTTYKYKREWHHVATVHFGALDVQFIHVEDRGTV